MPLNKEPKHFINLHLIHILAIFKLSDRLHIYLFKSIYTYSSMYVYVSISFSFSCLSIYLSLNISILVSFCVYVYMYIVEKWHGNMS